MCSRFQAASLVASPSYPNSIAWSEENLIAVANGQLVTILNPELPFGPRGLIKIAASKPFPVGMIKAEDVVSGCLLPTCLSRDRACSRSISWSPLGIAANSGCLLAICTAEGRVKIYRPPFCDYSAEWVEVIDISESLYHHLMKVNFKNPSLPSSEISHFAGVHPIVDNPSNLGPRGEQKRKRLSESDTIVRCNIKDSGSGAEQSSLGISSHIDETLGHGSQEVLAIEYSNWKDTSQDLSISQAKSRRREDESSRLPVITAGQYTSRSAMLSSLVVAWSPLLQSSSSDSHSAIEVSSSRFSVLALGGKSGEISFWRIGMPKIYSIEHANVHCSAMFISSLHAHNSWVTAISWLLLSADSSTSHVCLASGSSDGSVRIWIGSAEDFAKSSEATSCPFVLLKEIISADTFPAPVSILSLTATSEIQHKMLIAVGKGSGSLEVWADNKISSGFEKINSLDAHDHVVTGLAWAYDGNSLFSCSQDNIVRRWRLDRNILSEAPIASSTPGQRVFGDLPNSFYSCFGLAVSPGNAVLAMVRSFDSDLLNPMYQSKSLKAAVEFFWIGGQDHSILSKKSLESKTKPGPCFPEEEIGCWKSNILWSLKQFESPSKPLLVWDVIAALLVFKRTSPELVEQILVEWLSTAYLGMNANQAVENILSNVSRSFSKFTTRQLQLINVICRRVALSEMKPDHISGGAHKQGMVQKTALEEVESWINLLVGCEREIRERLVAYIISFCSSFGSQSEESQSRSGMLPLSGLAQLKQWAARNKALADNQLKDPCTGLRTYKRRFNTGRDKTEEKCSFCLASVPFESPEVAFCNGQETINEERQRHRLVRCAVSMQVCPPTTPLWFCPCCHRRTFKLGPEPFFTMARNPGSSQSMYESRAREVLAKPLCPFCGILMQRLQPEFLLSAAPV